MHSVSDWNVSTNISPQPKQPNIKTTLVSRMERILKRALRRRGFLFNIMK
jgi:hypothetical protein